jgi:hypothetical protein
MLAPSQASTLTARVTAPLAKGHLRRSSAGLGRSKSWSRILSMQTMGTLQQKPEALPHDVRRLCVPTAVMRGSKLMFSSSSWNLSRPLRALIAVALAIIGAVVVWAALARPSTPEPALAPARMIRACRRRLAVCASPPPNDLQRERIRSTFATGPRGWFCRNLTQWPYLYRGLVSNRRWSTLG